MSSVNRTVRLSLALAAALGAAALAAACDDAAAPASTCLVDGVSHAVGSQFPSPDGCNTCQCGADGVVACTARACVTTCTYDGTTWPVDAQFPATDGCNSCICLADGTVGCTQVACACDPSTEWWRQYQLTTPAACATADLACPDHTDPFNNTCGCGCEQASTCARTITCAPPACDPEAARAVCPYSNVDSTPKCSAESPCPSDGSMCFAPGESIGCGICRDPPEGETCASDDKCGDGLICEPVRCACSGQSACVPGCTAETDCGLGQACDLASDRCTPQACGGAAACPADFDCADGRCARRACTASATCDGSCVKGLCYAEPGFCSFMPP